MLKEFSARHQERIARQGERRGKVHTLLGEFKKERIEAAKNWRSAQKKMAQRRTDLPKAIKAEA
jgi:hypothetical protein